VAGRGFGRALAPRVVRITAAVLLSVAALAPPAAGAETPGSLDPSFGTGGVARALFSGGPAFEYAMARQPDGKIVVAGEQSVGQTVGFALARFTSDGELDPSFGTGGRVVTTTISAQYAQAFAVVVQPDGKIVAGGIAHGRMAFARYLPDGSLDPTFGTDGVVYVIFPDGVVYANGLALDNAGRIVAAGPYSGIGVIEFAVVRLEPDGDVDTAFGTDGRVTTGFSAGGAPVC
jgi:uncharacterized delta-60 repeat protein